MGSESAHGCAQNAENRFGVDFFDRYHKDGDEFLNHIVTGDETWVRSQSSGCTRIHQTSRKSLNKRLSARKLTVYVFWNRKGVLMVEFMPQGTTITSEVYCL
jgi:hypothetical protein